MCADFPAIPNFLKLTPEQRKAAWMKNPPMKAPAFTAPPKAEDPATAALRAEIEAQKKAATAARIAQLRERYGKRSG